MPSLLLCGPHATHPMLMYEDILVKHSSAFPVNPDSLPIFLSCTHQQAFDGLVQGLRRGYRLQFLSGPPGTGKSAVLTHFRQRMTTLRSVYLTHSCMGSINDYIDRICTEFDLIEPRAAEITDADLFSELRSQLVDAGNPLLLVDNAEGVDSDSLAILDTLSLKLSIPVILSGDCDFEQLASEADSEPTSHRHRTLHLDTMRHKETGQYILHRLNAFALDPDTFTTAAVDSIHTYSSGNPRLINLLCSNCIILMGLNDRSRIDADMVHASARNRQASGIYPFTATPADASHPHTPRPRAARLYRAPPHTLTLKPEPDTPTGPRDAPELPRSGRLEPYLTDACDSQPRIVTDTRPPARARKPSWLRTGIILLVGVSACLFLYASDISEYRGRFDTLLRSTQQLYASGRSAVQDVIYSGSRRLPPTPAVDSSADTIVSRPADAVAPDPPAPAATAIAADERLQQIEEEIRGKETQLNQLEARIDALNAKLDAAPAGRQTAEPQPAGTPPAQTPEREPDATDNTAGAQPDTNTDPQISSPAQKRHLIRTYLERASYELDRGQIEQAHISIARGLEVDPYNRALQELRRQAYLAE